MTESKLTDAELAEIREYWTEKTLQNIAYLPNAQARLQEDVPKLLDEVEEWKGTAEANAIQRDQASAACTKYREEAEKLKNIIMNHVYKHGCEFGIDLEDDVNPWKAEAELMKSDRDRRRTRAKRLEKALNEILYADECFLGDIMNRMHAMQDKAREALKGSDSE